MAARLGNGKKSLHPRLVQSIGGVEQPRGSAFGDIEVKDEHMHFIREAMKGVTTFGTAAAVADLGLGPDIKMAGKTGTAQGFNYNGGRGVHGYMGPWALRDHAWFVAYAPVDDPRYAIAVLVEHGGFGAQAAAPRAREIMRTALLKDPEIRARIEKPLPMPAAPTGPASGDVVPDLPATPVDPNAQPGVAGAPTDAGQPT
jgi:penicillin-binding protein 2